MVYYLQSRYYNPQWGRFLNADLPEIAQESKDEINGLNLFAYCCNDPVNSIDIKGYWGRKVHNGYCESTNDHYYYTFIQNCATPYGTYYWAKVCGFTSKNAKKLAEYCEELDIKYGSTRYALALLPGQNYTAEQIANFYKWQFYHFNKYKRGSKDSRREFAEKKLEAAKHAWSNGDKELAIKHLGYGLHAIQDIFAHGQIGRGLLIPQHITLGIGNPNSKNVADNINYEWCNTARTKLRKNSVEKPRLIETREHTKKYLERFISYIGGKDKI